MNTVRVFSELPDKTFLPVDKDDFLETFMNAVKNDNSVIMYNPENEQRVEMVVTRKAAESLENMDELLARITMLSNKGTFIIGFTDNETRECDAYVLTSVGSVACSYASGTCCEEHAKKTTRKPNVIPNGEPTEKPNTGNPARNPARKPNGKNRRKPKNWTPRTKKNPNTGNPKNEFSLSNEEWPALGS